MSWFNTWHFSSCGIARPVGGLPVHGKELPPRQTLTALQFLERRVYDSGLHRDASDRLHQPFVSFCTIYNSENFIFILAPCTLSATQAGFQAMQWAALRARLPWNSPRSFPLH